MRHQLVEFYGSTYWQKFQLTADVLKLNKTEFQIEYVLTGPLDEVLIPDKYQGMYRRTEGLWEETCFEFFIAGDSEQKYFEFNFSPDTSWDAYQFEHYRQKAQLQELIEVPQFDFYKTENSNLFKMVCRIQGPQSIAVQNNYDYSVTTVLKNKNGEVSYWALKHAGDKPDFHLRDSFIGKMT